MKFRKGQEEMVGFVLIVVIVAVVLVVLLGIFLRSPKQQAEESMEARQFLGSMMEFTSECAIGYEPAYANLGELMGRCYDNKVCVSGKSACNVLNKTLNEVIEASFGIAPEAYYNGFELNAVYNSSTSERQIIILSKGNCTSYKGADYFFSHQGGTIDVLLKLCTG